MSDPTSWDAVVSEREVALRERLGRLLDDEALRMLAEEDVGRPPIVVTVIGLEPTRIITRRDGSDTMLRVIRVTCPDGARSIDLWGDRAALPADIGISEGDGLRIDGYRLTEDRFGRKVSLSRDSVVERCEGL